MYIHLWSIKWKTKMSEEEQKKTLLQQNKQKQGKKKDIRKNAIDLSTHFLHFIAEIVQIIGWLIANLTFTINLNFYSLLLFVFQNGFLSAPSAMLKFCTHFIAINLPFSMPESRVTAQKSPFATTYCDSLFMHAVSISQICTQNGM